MSQENIIEQDPASSGRKTTTNKKSSDRRIAASQANGKLSTGPKTGQGRQKCAEAAAAQIKHGMLAQTVILNGESKSEFTAILRGFIAHYNPISAPEYAVIYKMVVAYWRQLRTWSFQQTDFHLEMARQEPDLPLPLQAALAARALNGKTPSDGYESAYDRQFTRALKDFKFLKAQRDPASGIDSTPLSFTGSTWEQKDDH